MKKKLAIVAVALVLLYPGAVWLMGLLAEERMTATLAQLSEQTPWLRIVDQHYHRGWYRSEQELTFEAQIPNLLPLPTAVATSPRGVRFGVRNLIHHGPVCGSGCFGLARVDTSFVPGPELAPLISRWYGSMSPIAASTRLGFLGSRSFTFSSPPLRDVRLNNDTRLSWDGFTVQGHVSRDNARIELRGAMPGFAARSADGKQLQLSALTFDGSSERVLGMLYSSQWVVQVDRIVFRSPAAPDFSIEKVRCAARSPRSAGFMDVSQQIGTGAFQAGGVQLRELHFDFTLRHLQVEALAALQEQMRAYNRARGPAPMPDLAGLGAALHEPVQRLLLAGPELRFDRVGITTAHGQMLLTGSLRAPGLTAADLAAQSDVRALQRKIALDLDVTLDDGALSDLPALGATARERLAVLSQAGLVTHENGRWHTHLQIADGRTAFNGKPVATPRLPGPTPGLRGPTSGLPGAAPATP